MTGPILIFGAAALGSLAGYAALAALVAWTERRDGTR